MALNHSKLNISAGLASASVALTLVALKLWALSETGALSIAASLADSALDLFISLTGLAALIYAGKPADEDHQFGHGSAEDLAALAQASLLTVSALAIGYASIGRLLADTPPDLQSEGRGIAVMIVSVTLTSALLLYQRRVISATGSRVVSADALHYLSDLLPNIGAIIALIASRWLDLPLIDSVIALAAALILLSGAARIGREAFNALMDRSAPQEFVDRLSEEIGNWPEVQGHHDLKTRTAGATTFVQVHIELDGSQTLKQAHDIGAALRSHLLKRFPNTEIIIHKDVADE